MKPIYNIYEGGRIVLTRTGLNTFVIESDPPGVLDTTELEMMQRDSVAVNLPPVILEPSADGLIEVGQAE